MWDKQYKKAKWNGLVFDILNTEETRANKVHVEELPYSDDPYIKQMGVKAKALKITAVFVGEQSLASANSFIDSIEANPTGKLEHPYLGELELEYLTSSISFSTRKGIVNVSLTFVRQGKEITLPELLSERIEPLIIQAETASANKFVELVDSLSVSEYTSLRLEFSTFLNKIKKIAATLQIPSQLVSELVREINDGLNAISSIINAPQAFADQFNAIINSFVKQVKNNDKQTSKRKLEKLTSNATPSYNAHVEQTTYLLLVGSKAKQTEQVLQKLEPTIDNHHLKTMMSLTILQLNPVLKLISTTTTTDVVDILSRQLPLRQLVNNLDITNKMMQRRITEATDAASFDNLELADNLMLIRSELFFQQEKLKLVTRNIFEKHIQTPTPNLVIAHEQETNLAIFEGLNQQPHPLFMTDKVSFYNE